MDGLLVLVWYVFAVGLGYPIVVSAVLGAAVMVRRSFRPSLPQCLALVAPAATYFLLAMSDERQGWNTWRAWAEVTAFGSLVIVVACAARRPRWLVTGSFLGAVFAVGVWQWVPNLGWTGPLF
jgi:hypothetical protein